MTIADRGRSAAAMSDTQWLLSLPTSASFGLTEAGSPLNTFTLYRVDTEAASELSFDTSNNFISASVTKEGIVRRACICRSVEALPADEELGGALCAKQLLYGGPWSYRAQLETTSSIEGTRAHSVSVALVENVIPLFTEIYGDILIHRLVFTPVSGRSAPRAVLQVLMIENRHSDLHTLICSSGLPNPLAQSNTVSREGGVAATRSAQWSSQRFLYDALPLEQELSVPARSTEAIWTAWLLGEDERELTETEHLLSSRTPRDWLSETLAVRRQAYGDLRIPEAQPFAEMVVRFSELCRQSALRNRQREICGGFLGSNVNERSYNFTRDSYFSMLAMTMFDPALAADSIPFFLTWGCPTEVRNSVKVRFPNAGPITQSLSNAVSGLTLAGAYFRATGDKDYFLSNPGILTQAKALLADVLESRMGSPFLFPSCYYSDGEARGDYHTGSNIAAWFAFQSMSRLAADVYQDAPLARSWHDIAAAIKADLERHCVQHGSQGSRFVEGANADGSFVTCHDGEESDSTLMPFYGFCQTDDVRLLRHAEFALSNANPLYSEAIDGIWWYRNGQWKSAAFTGWITALACASQEEQLSPRLDRIAQLTDVDGSIWWWPYDYGSQDRYAPLREGWAGKSGWAAAVYLCRFIHGLLGIDIDVPARTVQFAPFLPWSEFLWRKARLGAGFFDFGYEKLGNRISLSILNRNDADFEASVVVTAPPGSSPTVPEVSGGRLLRTDSCVRFGRPALRLKIVVPPGSKMEAVVLLTSAQIMQY